MYASITINLHISLCLHYLKSIERMTLNNDCVILSRWQTFQIFIFWRCQIFIEWFWGFFWFFYHCAYQAMGDRGWALTSMRSFWWSPWDEVLKLTESCWIWIACKKMPFKETNVANCMWFKYKDGSSKEILCVEKWESSSHSLKSKPGEL